MSERDDTNFEFLGSDDERVRRLGEQAERYVHTDPESCLFKLRLMIETMAHRLAELDRPDLVSKDLAKMLRNLQRSGIMPRRTADLMHAIRRDGNAAVHGKPMPAPTAMRRLRDAHRLAGWFVGIVQRGSAARAGKFVPPARPMPIDEAAAAAIERAEQLEADIERQRAETREALVLFGEGFDPEVDGARIVAELEALDRIADAAGEPMVDADSVSLVMAMELEQLLAHPRLGLTVQQARGVASGELQAVRAELERREAHYEAERSAIAGATQVHPD
ncbi:MAG: DUF4145 domain-containing protein [Phycisphaerales bacterium]